jgi:hypothetical protein
MVLEDLWHQQFLAFPEIPEDQASLVDPVFQVLQVDLVVLKIQDCRAFQDFRVILVFLLVR